MPKFQTISYTEWRRQVFSTQMFHDGVAAPPPERLLQAIWHHQRLRRDQLQTVDGRSLRILHPGFWNHEAGPDFRGAIVQFDTDQAQCGDVEIDLRPADWHNHGHDQNAAFRNVVLHVVWEGPGHSSQPTLELKSLLDAPVSELGEWLDSGNAHQLPAAMAGRCAAPLTEVSAERLADLLRQAALCRLQAKASQLQARARQAGWEQALWEGLCRALGYKHNGWPMQRIAEVVAGSPTDSSVDSVVLAWQARLLGVAGLLPAEPSDAATGAQGYFRRVWDVWWRERDAFAEFVLPRQVWRFHGMRPPNHPQRRLALAGHWLAGSGFFERLENWFLSGHERKAPGKFLLEALQVRADDYWSWHWKLDAVRLPKPQPLLGVARLTDLAMNAILPWFWIRAVAGQSQELQQTAETLYFAWPAAEDNAVLRFARQRLLGKVNQRPFRTAAEQQGLLQIVRDFCEHSNALCEACPFPGLILKAAPGSP